VALSWAKLSGRQETRPHLKLQKNAVKLLVVPKGRQALNQQLQEFKNLPQRSRKTNHMEILTQRLLSQ